MLSKQAGPHGEHIPASSDPTLLLQELVPPHGLKPLHCLSLATATEGEEGIIRTAFPLFHNTSRLHIYPTQHLQ